MGHEQTFPKRPAAAIAAALLESERRFNEITETSLQAKIVHRHFKPVFANTAFLRLMGFTAKEQLLACPDVLALFDHQTQADPLTAWQRAITGGPLRSRLLMHRRNGEAFLADVFARPVLWDDEPAIALALMDVTAEEASRRALTLAKVEAESATRAKRRFLSAASHGLRTPLHAAMGRLQLLQRANLAPSHADMVDESMRACQRLLHHVDDVLDCASLETGELAWAKEAFRPVAAADEAIQIASDGVEGVAIKHSVEGDPSLEFVGDDRRTQRIVLALIEEAICRGPLGPVELQTCMDGEGLSFTLTTPCAANAASPEQEGAGPIDGMALARQLCGAMGGVMVERSPAAHLWCVTVFLPFTLVAKPAAEPASAPVGRKGAKVLVVEDNAGNRRLLHVILASLGHAPLAVSGGAEAVVEVSRRRFDLVLMDLSMPGIDGFEATRRIRALSDPRNRVPIVALTASTGPETRERAQEAGMDGFLQKPVEIQKLAATIALFTPASETEAGAESERLAQAPLIDPPLIDAPEIQQIQGQNDNEKRNDGGERGHALALSAAETESAAS